MLLEFLDVGRDKITFSVNMRMKVNCNTLTTHNQLLRWLSGWTQPGSGSVSGVPVLPGDAGRGGGPHM